MDITEASCGHLEIESMTLLLQKNTKIKINFAIKNKIDRKKFLKSFANTQRLQIVNY